MLGCLYRCSRILRWNEGFSSFQAVRGIQGATQRCKATRDSAKRLTVWRTSFSWIAPLATTLSVSFSLLPPLSLSCAFSERAVFLLIAGVFPDKTSSACPSFTLVSLPLSAAMRMHRIERCFVLRATLFSFSVVNLVFRARSRAPTFK